MVSPWLTLHIISAVMITMSWLPVQSVANIMPQFSPKINSIILKFVEGPETPVGTVLHKFKGVDSDGDTLTYTAKGEPPSPNGPTLKIERTSRTEANLVLKRELDREENSGYALRVTLNDGRTKKPASQNILIIVMDVNDNYPKFDKFVDTYEIRENGAVPVAIASFRAEDPDEGPNGEVDYSLRFLDEGDQSLFDIELDDNVDNDRVKLRLISPLDFEKKFKHVIQLVARDKPITKNTTPKETVTNITINVIDVSDSPPVFLERKGPVPEIPEDAPLHSHVVQVKAKDGDSSFNSSIYYELINELDKFSIEPYSGIIKTRFRFNMDPNTVHVYKLRVKATETGLPQGVEISSKLTPSQSAAWSETEVLVSVTEVWGSPRFRNETYVGHVPENSPPGYPVVMRKGFLTEVCDNDKGGRDLIKLTVEGDGDTFEVVPKEGYARVMFQIVVKNPLRLDYERLQEIDFHLIAEDSAGNRTRLLVSVFITDQNDNSPVFRESRYFVKIPENPPSGLLVAKVTATDKDTGLFGDSGLRYVSLKGLAERELHLDKVTGEISVVTMEDADSASRSVFDREGNPEIYMTVIVQDNMGKGNIDTAMIVIQLQDKNDNSPQFLQSFYETEIYENQENISLALRVSAFDADEPNTNNSRIRYTLIHNAANGETDILSGHLKIDAKSGVLFLKKSFDFEKIYQSYADSLEPSIDYPSPLKFPVKLRIQANDLGNPRQATQVPFTLFIIDKNDCAPEFAHLVYNATVREDLAEDQAIIRVNAVDEDASPGYKAVVFSVIRDTDDANRFTIDPKSGAVTLAKGSSFDWNLQNEYIFHVGCMDELNFKSEMTAVAKVTVLDVNDKPPVFIRTKTDKCRAIENHSISIYYSASVPENTPEGVKITRVTATDPDSGHELRYQINYHESKVRKDGKDLGAKWDLQEYLMIDPVSGEITTGQEAFDYEEVDSLIVTVLVEDITGEINTPQIATAFLLIDVLNVNDLRPRFLKSEYKAIVKENSPFGTEVVPVKTVGDEGVDLEYSIDKQEIPFEVDPVKGMIRVRGLVDREMNEWHNFTVKATAANNLFSRVPVFIEVEDENDNLPVFTDSTGNVSVEENAPTGKIIARIHATDKDAGSYGQLVYFLEGDYESKFSIDKTLGVISISGLVDREQRDKYELVVRAIDNFHGYPSSDNSHSVTKVIHVQVKDVNDNPPQFHFLNDQERVDGRHEFVVMENAAANYPIFSFSVTDDDQQGTPNAVIVVTLAKTEKKESLLFKLQENKQDEHLQGSKTWTLLTARSLAGFTGNHTVTLEAQDKGIPQNKAMQEVTILVKSVGPIPYRNTVTFKFTQTRFTATITSGYLEGTEILQVSLTGFQGVDAYDAATISENLKFSLMPIFAYSKPNNNILSNLFSIHPISGIIQVGFNVNEETYPHSYYSFNVIANWTSKDRRSNDYGTSAKLTIYKVAHHQKIQLLSRRALENGEARKKSYQLGKYLEKLFGLLVSVDTTEVTTGESNNAALLYEVCFILPQTNQVLESRDIENMFASARSELLRIFQKFQLTYIEKSLDTDDDDIDRETFLMKVWKFVFASQHQHLYTVSDANTLYLYYSLLIVSVILFEVATFVIAIVFVYLFDNIRPGVDLEEETKYYYNNLLLLKTTEFRQEIRELYAVRLDDDADNEKSFESDC